MTKLVNLLGRKSPTAAEKPAESTVAAPETAVAVQAVPAFLKPESEKAEIDIDNELFFPLATQLGQENETVRNLLIDAEHKIGELETIKNSIGKLVAGATMQELATFALDLQGQAGVVWDQTSPQEGRFQALLMRSPATRIEGGSDEKIGRAHV